MRKRWPERLVALAIAALPGLCLVLCLVACTSKPRQKPAAQTRDAGAAPAPPAAGPRITSLDPPPRPRDGEPVLPEPKLRLPLRESLRLEAPGEEPRRKLRYALDDRARRYTLDAKLSAREFAGSAAQPTPVAIPPFRERFDVKVEKRPGGAQRWSWHGDPITVDGDATAAAPYVLRWKALLANRNATLTLDEHALPREITFAEDPLREKSAPESEELTQRLLGQIVPLPPEPIGKGARWTVVTVLRQGFVSVKQTASYELVELAGDQLTLAVDVRRVGAEQLVDLPDAPPGAQVELLALFRATTGKLTVELSAALPTSGALTIEARSHQRLTAPGGKVSELITEDLGTLVLSSEAL